MISRAADVIYWALSLGAVFIAFSAFYAGFDRDDMVIVLIIAVLTWCAGRAARYVIQGR